MSDTGQGIRPTFVSLIQRSIIGVSIQCVVVLTQILVATFCFNFLRTLARTLRMKCTWHLCPLPFGDSSPKTFYSTGNPSIIPRVTVRLSRLDGSYEYARDSESNNRLICAIGDILAKYTAGSVKAISEQSGNRVSMHPGVIDKFLPKD